ncbi:MAG: hypothetical protein FD124_3800, partial [Alphaproteobacteria bacterium]
RMTTAELAQWSTDRHPDNGYRYDDVDWNLWKQNRADSWINEVMIHLEDLESHSLTPDAAPIFLAFLQQSGGDFAAAQQQMDTTLTAMK